MREIKFRGYNDSGVPGTKWREVKELRWSDRNGITGNLKGGGTVERCLLMGTGLLDAKNQEIFQDDVVTDGTRNFVVVWKIGAFWGVQINADGSIKKRQNEKPLAYLPARLTIVTNGFNVKGVDELAHPNTKIGEDRE